MPGTTTIVHLLPCSDTNHLESSVVNDRTYSFPSAAVCVLVGEVASIRGRFVSGSSSEVEESRTSLKTALVGGYNRRLTSPQGRNKFIVIIRVSVMSRCCRHGLAAERGLSIFGCGNNHLRPQSTRRRLSFPTYISPPPIRTRHGMEVGPVKGTWDIQVYGDLNHSDENQRASYSHNYLP